jgi:hypothetical protein
MNPVRTSLKSLAIQLTAAASALVLASCAGEPPPPPLPPVVIPPAAPPPPPVALSPSVLEAAGAYRIYVRNASGVTAAFANGQSVEDAVTVGASYEPKQFLRGEIAYAALVALQSPQFVAGVRTYAVEPAGRMDLANRLIADPNYAAALPSAASAALLVSNTLRADAAKIRQAGELVKQAAYDVQRQDWSKAEVVGRDARLNNAKLVSGQPIATPPEDVALLGKAVNQSDITGLALADVSAADPASAQFTAIVNRALAVAALAALGEGGQANDQALQRLLDDNSNAFCLNLAKLNLYQCLSVAKPYYEDVFCLGQHILIDTAQCMAKGAGGATAAELAPPPAPIPVAQPKPPVTKAPARPAKRPAAKRAAR